MSDRFRPIPFEQLAAWIFTELEQKGSVCGIPRELFFTPAREDRFRLRKYDQLLETPFGVAAGPHSQLAQNIVVAWLCGARFIELKTVQTLDELEITKPCIDMEDEGYNVEWSQELKVRESYDEYLRAWVLIHALHRKLGFPGDRPGIIFNLSVGYDLKGIQSANMQWYLDRVRDTSKDLGACVDVVAGHFPEVREIEIPPSLSDNVTLSTMHGCPPDEIESICAYLLQERKLHTSVKLNPTLLGPETVRGILQDLKYDEVVVPDAAFEHDLKYADAVPMLRRLHQRAITEDLTFGVKLSNTLEVENHRVAFPANEKQMYLSGRPLHALTTQLASTLAEELGGKLLMSFSAGADAFNVAHLLRSGMKTVTVCSDLLKSGGYLRMLQYLENTEAAMDALGATDLADLSVRAALAPGGAVEELASPLRRALADTPGAALDSGACRALLVALAGSGGAAAYSATTHAWASDRGLSAEAAGALAEAVRNVSARRNLRAYAETTRREPLLTKGRFFTQKSKTKRTLDLFDCIEAPCVDECAVDQRVPQYMRAVREGRYADAVELTRRDNPIPTMLGRVCDHLCENTCIRTHYDEPLAIRDIKRFIMEQKAGQASPTTRRTTPTPAGKVGIIGAGPCGLSAAYFLRQAGYDCTIFEVCSFAGGIPAGTIPIYRLPQTTIDQDVQVLERLGVELRYGQRAGTDFMLSDLRRQGFEHIVIAVGAQLSKRLGLPGEEAHGVMDAIYFLRRVRASKPIELGARIGVIGAGDTAMDCARSAHRLTDSKVTVIYRRTISQMPADREEVRCLLEEGIEVLELASPKALIVNEGRLQGLVCQRMKLGERAADGRRRPVAVAGEELTIELDTLIVAISQESVLDFFDGEEPELTRKGYVKTDALTGESSLENVYAGGDVALDGPQSIVRAAGDGRRIADAICRKAGGPASRYEPCDEGDLPELLRRRSRRELRVPIPHRPLDDRDHFKEVTFTLTEEAAQREASRCLDCQTICSLCVGVCPNLAIMTYQTAALEVRLPELEMGGDGLTRSIGRTFRVEQQHQVAVQTDFCNECGNCTTFCPTAGRPYIDKPRLFLHRGDFEAETDNAFMVFQGGAVYGMQGRFAGETHEIVVDSAIRYRAPGFTARLNRETLELEEAVPRADLAPGTTLSLEPAAVMAALLLGLTGSMPHLLVAAPDDRSPLADRA